jgi:adenylosuccinate lyase
MVFSQAVLLALTEAGCSRQEAYAWVQRCAMRIWQEDLDFQRSLQEDPDISARLTPGVLARCFDLEHHLRHVDHIFARTLALKGDRPGRLMTTNPNPGRQVSP